MATTTIGNELLRKPDVYLIETEVGGQALQLAGTGAAAMIGVTDKGPISRATLVTSLTQFYREFGHDLSFPLVRAARAYFNMGGHRLYVVRTSHYTDITDPTSYTATAASVTINDGNETSPTDVLKIDAKTPGTWGNNLVVVIENVDANANTCDIVVYEGSSNWYAVKERWAGVSLDESDEKFVENVVNHPQGGSRNIVVTYLPASGVVLPQEGTYHLTGGDNGTTGIVDADYIGDKGAGTAMYALDNVREMLTISHPGVTSDTVISSAMSYILYNTNRRPPQTDFYVYDIPEGYTPQEALEFIANLPAGSTGYEAVYYPWLEVEGEYEPAAPYMQGVYSHNDRIRGVWQAPAGTKFPIGWASGLSYELTEGDQELLNPHGINCIVRKPFHGIVPWGARTLHVHHKDRYIQARRLVNLIKKTLYDGSQQFLFELNAPKVWQRIEDTAHGLLMLLYDMGAFGGKTPEESFFVKCDEDTNPPELVEQGVAVAKVGIVPPKPIEFLVFDIMLYPEGSLPEGIEKYLNT